MKPIPGFPNYKITKNGRVWSIHRKIYLKQNKNKGGYYYVCLYNQGKGHFKHIHQLVLKTYIGSCPEGMETCHNNGNPEDNRLENLRWDTRSNNVRDSVRHGTWVDNSGEKSGQTNLNNLQVRVIRRLLESKILFQREIGKIFGVNQRTISQIKMGKRWAIH